MCTLITPWRRGVNLYTFGWALGPPILSSSPPMMRSAPQRCHLAEPVSLLRESTYFRAARKTPERLPKAKHLYLL